MICTPENCDCDCHMFVGGSGRPCPDCLARETDSKSIGGNCPVDDLESRPEVCKCGHVKEYHYFNDGYCCHVKGKKLRKNSKSCLCKSFEVKA